MQEVQETLDGEKRPYKVVYTIVERGSGVDRKTFWVRIGSAFVNRDQSLNVKLDAHPTNGALHIRDYVPFEDRKRDEAVGAAAGAIGGAR